MAVIGTIRKQSTFLVIIIGVALAAFVLGDFAKGGGASREVNIGKVEGEEITIMDFNMKVDQNIESTKQQQNKERLEPDEVFRLKNDTWTQMVSDIIYQNEYTELGIEVTSDELFELVQGPNPHPLIQQYFTNPQTGIYDRNLVIQYLQNLDNLPAASKQQWFLLESYIKNDRLRNKYNALISKGFYVPTDLASMAFEEENSKARIEYVGKIYSAVPDSLFTPTDEDYNKQYEKHKERFEQEAYRDMDYVVFDIIPSITDLQNARKEMDEIYKEFDETVDVPRFVLVNSDQPYDSAWKTDGQLPVQIDSIMFNSEVGTVVKPYMVSNTFYLSRLAEIELRPDSMKATHILLAYQGAFRADPAITRTREQSQILADSIQHVLAKSSNKISMLAKELSDDPSAQTNDGDLGWFADGAMVTNFNEAVIDNKVGSVVVAETQFGFHIIKVTGKKDPVKKVRVATVVQEVIPSSETYQQTFAKASKLASENQTMEEFDIAVEDERLNKRTVQKLHAMDNRIAGLNYPRQLILWAFNENTQEGSVSDVFDLDDQFIVAVVTNKAEKGFPPVDEIKTRLNTYVYNELRGKIILDEMSAQNNDMDQLSEEEGFKKSELGALTFTARNLQGYGAENEIIGTVFGMNNGDVIGPVEGAGGVFLVKLDNIVTAGQQDDYSSTITKLEDTWYRRIEQGIIYRTLQETVEIEDNRYLFY